ncbi:MAG: MFS transporter [Spirochaetaceae bacterium]|nr:MFS transporter [Spirochaetaceae bacterium]
MDFRVPSTSRFALLMLFFWGGWVVIETFMVPYLTDIGFSERQVGFIISAFFLVSIGSQPLWGYVADRTDGHRWIIAIAMLAALLSMLVLRGSGAVFGLVLVSALVYSLTAGSMPGLVDSWIMQIDGGGVSINYGAARGFGSLGFAVAAMTLGFVLERFGLPLMFVIYAVFSLVVISLVITMRVPQLAPPARAISDNAPMASGSPIRAVLSNGPYLIFLSSAFLVLLGARAASTFMPLRFYELGGTNVHVGWAQAVKAAGEIPFMFLSALILRRVAPRVLLLGSMALLVVRLVLMRLAPSAATLVAAQVVQGMAIGFFLPAAVHYINRIAPQEHRSLFQTLAPSIAFGLATVVGSSVGGVLVEQFGLDSLYTVVPAVAGMGVILFGGSLVFGCREHSS